MTTIQTAQHALNTLRKARDLDAKAWGQHVAYLRHHSSTQLRRSEANADKAALMFIEVEKYLERKAS